MSNQTTAASTKLPSLKAQRGLNQDKQIKFISMIDSKPIVPAYLELIPLKNFSKKEAEAQRERFKEH